MAFQLEDNEHIVRIARRHWFKPVSETLGLLFSLLIPLIAATIVSALPLTPAEIGNVGLLAIIFTIGWFFIIWNLAFIIWTNHYLDVLVVTNKHVIDIEQIGLWNREISTLDLDKIQDISSKREGMIPNLLEYGDLEIQTAGSITNFIVKNIEQPDAVRQEINTQISAQEDRTINAPFG